jgi:hypothetical protein
MEKTFHLKQDLGINKQVLVRHFKEQYGELPSEEFKERGLDMIQFLLNKPTQRYTTMEVRLILREYWTSHDDCVYENEDDFSNIEVYHVNKKIKLIEDAYKLMHE